MIFDDYEYLPLKVQENLAQLEELGVQYQIKIFEEPAHRASQAAELLACEMGAVVKSLVFLINAKDLLLVLVSGENRVDIRQLKHIVDQEITQATPADVKKLTGYTVGSVPPFGIPGDFRVIIDRDLTNHSFVWAAAGSAHVLIRITPKDLQTLSGGMVKVINHH